MTEPLNALFELLDGVCSGQTSVAEFHQRLEPALFNLPYSVGIPDDKIREFANRLELIVFTERSGDQPGAAARLAVDIKKYISSSS